MYDYVLILATDSSCHLGVARSVHHHPGLLDFLMPRNTRMYISVTALFVSPQNASDFVHLRLHPACSSGLGRLDLLLLDPGPLAWQRFEIFSLRSCSKYTVQLSSVADVG